MVSPIATNGSKKYQLSVLIEEQHKNILDLARKEIALQFGKPIDAVKDAEVVRYIIWNFGKKQGWVKIQEQ